VTILCPTPGASTNDPKVLVAVSLNQNLRKMPPEDLVLEINGRDVTGKASITPEILTYTDNDLTPGDYYISLSLKQSKTRRWNCCKLVFLFKTRKMTRK
jgi:hypothetical protein